MISPEMKRPTIPDLAQAAGVSVSTVNRIIKNSGKVRQSTRELVLQTAEEIGFYGLGTLSGTVKSRRETHHLGVLLQQPGRPFYRQLGDAIKKATDTWSSGRVILNLEFMDDLSPESVASHIERLGERSESLAIVAAQHPVIAEAIENVNAQGVPVTALIGPLSARCNISFVGLDNWKVGRTAAWAFDKMVRKPGKIGVLVGNHRFRNQEMNESGFRSYMREHNSGFTLLEPQSTYESAAAAREIVETMLIKHPDLCGLFASGGGISGVIAALREGKTRDDFVAVGYELFDTTRSALADGTLTMVIGHPMDAFAREAIATLIKSKAAGADGGAHRTALGFEIYTSENT